MQVCRQWRREASQERLWMHVIAKRFPFLVTDDFYMEHRFWYANQESWDELTRIRARLLAAGAGDRASTG